MKKETDTVCREKIDGKECRGGIFKNLAKTNRMSEASNLRYYICDKCGKEYLWKEM